MRMSIRLKFSRNTLEEENTDHIGWGGRYNVQLSGDSLDWSFFESVKVDGVTGLTDKLVINITSSEEIIFPVHVEVAMWPGFNLVRL